MPSWRGALLKKSTGINLPSNLPCRGSNLFNITAHTRRYAASWNNGHVEVTFSSELQSGKYKTRVYKSVMNVHINGEIIQN